MYLTVNLIPRKPIASGGSLLAKIPPQANGKVVSCKPDGSDKKQFFIQIRITDIHCIEVMIMTKYDVMQSIELSSLAYKEIQPDLP